MIQGIGFRRKLETFEKDALASKDGEDRTFGGDCPRYVNENIDLLCSALLAPF